MPIFEVTPSHIVPLAITSFESQGIRERADLQRLLRDRVDAIVPDTLVLTEEFGDWEDSRRRIDLLGLDKAANLVVLELKRSEDRGATELQAIRYAAMVSAMTFEQIVATHQTYLAKRGVDRDAQESILAFLGWEAPDEPEFAQTVRIVLVAEEFSKELTTSVMWLNQRDLDIRCVRMKPYLLDTRILVDVQQVIPLPEAAEFQIRIKRKIQQEQAAKTSERDHTKYALTVGDKGYQKLPKRRTVLEAVRHICASGVAPHEITSLLPDGARRWRSVDGEVDSETFLALATAGAQADGKSFEERRWFWDDDELIRTGGRTYALSNQWGSGRAEFVAFMHALLAAFPGRGLVFRESE